MHVRVRVYVYVYGVFVVAVVRFIIISVKQSMSTGEEDLMHSINRRAAHRAHCHVTALDRLRTLGAQACVEARQHHGIHRYFPAEAAYSTILQGAMLLRLWLRFGFHQM